MNNQMNAHFLLSIGGFSYETKRMEKETRIVFTSYMIMDFIMNKMITNNNYNYNSMRFNVRS